MTGVDPRSISVGIHPDDLLEAIVEQANERAQREDD